MSPNTRNPISVFQDAHDVRLDHPMFNIANSVSIFLLARNQSTDSSIIVSDPLAYAIQYRSK